MNVKLNRIFIWRIDRLTKDMIDSVFAPLDNEDKDIYYIFPFYSEAKYNEMGFGVQILNEHECPLTYSSDASHEKYVVESKDDWINYMTKLVGWPDHCRKLIRMSRGY